MAEFAGSIDVVPEATIVGVNLQTRIASHECARPGAKIYFDGDIQQSEEFFQRQDEMYMQGMMVTPEMIDNLKVEMSAICDPAFGKICQWEVDNFFVLVIGKAYLVKLIGNRALQVRAVEPKRSDGLPRCRKST